MGFSSALQGPASHDAILLRIDAELRLLENMRRCIGLRIKSDSKYYINIRTRLEYKLRQCPKTKSKISQYLKSKNRNLFGFAKINFNYILF